MINISWSQFEINQQAKDISFESFCFQVAYILFKEFGFFDSYYNTPGSEFYLKLHTDCPELNLQSGDEVGWQVKWWFNSEDNSSLNTDHKNKLIENFKTTLHVHPKIKRWIICTPGAFVEKEFNKLKGELKTLSKNTEIEHWHKNSFINFRAANFEKLGFVFNHYFNTNFIGFDFLKKYSYRRIEDLTKKFDTDLYTPSQYDDEILFLLDYEKIFKELKIRVKYLQDEIEKIQSDNLFTKNDYKLFSKEYITKAYELLYLCINTSREIIEIITSKLSIEKCKYIQQIFKIYKSKYRELSDFLNKKINSKEHIVEGIIRENYIEERNHSEYIIGSINKIQGLLVSSKDESGKEKAIFDLIDFVFQKDLHILSSAGYGKTNIACNICLSSLKRNIPCLLILGSAFRKSEIPQKIILEQLGLSSKYEFKDLLNALNNLGFNKGVKVPIIIDGLNESVPFDVIWKTNIKDIIRDINELENIILITTCRDRYIESIFEEADVSHIRNTKTLVGFSENIRESAIRKYFNKYNIVPSSWNFNKDLFKNPLLLRIFSEVNENHKQIHISLDNIFNSIEKYSDIIENRASTKNSKIDPIIKQKIKSRIEDFCKLLWNSNRREIALSEFHNIIHPESESLENSLTEKLLDEGLCFQKNLSNEIETVQFTYDLVGGYSIASKVLLIPIISTDIISGKLKQFQIEEKLFIRATEHPLRQDILISLLHLVPEKLGLNLFEIFQNEVVIEECFNSIDYFIGNFKGQEKLLEVISREKKGSRNFKLLFEKLFENTYKKEVFGLENFTIKVLKNLNQAEIDIFWSELIRKNRLDVYLILFEIQKKYLRNKYHDRNEKQDLFFSFLSTTSSDKSIRSLATENLFLIAKQHPHKLVDLTREVILFNDLNSIESVLVALCGTILYFKEKQFTLFCIEILVNELIPNLKTTHICIIDYIQTIFEFAKIKFNIDLGNNVIFEKANFKINRSKNKSASKNTDYSIYYPEIFGLDMYDFNKHQISEIATNIYDKRKTYSQQDCLAIIFNAVVAKGYDEKYFESIQSDFNEDNRYKYGRGINDNLTVYPEKYIWQSYYELVGYLVLSKKLIPQDNNRFRCEYNFFDPTFPRLPQRFQLINDCFFPSNSNNIQGWINSEQQDYIDHFLIHNLRTHSDWVLLSAEITQKENDTRFHLTINSFLIPNKNIKLFKEEIEIRNYYESSNSFYNLYAGEINWSNFVLNKELGYHEEQWGLVNILYKYAWTGWTSNRFENPYFQFLNPELSSLDNLEFKLDDLSFYDNNSDQATKIVWTENAKLYFIRKDIIESIMQKKKLELIWFQFVTKYGEFGKHTNNKLNPTSKDLRRIFTYSSIKK